MRDLLVSIVDLHSVLIQWNDLSGEHFQLEKSTSPEGPFEVVAAHLIVPLFVDKDVNLFQRGLRYYYRVKVFMGGVEIQESSIATPEYNKPDGIANKLIYENRAVLKVMRNPPVYVLLKERSGKNCPNCYNPITKRPRFSDCNYCNGTGTIFGFHKPIKTLISRDISQQVDYKTMLDSQKINDTTVGAWITNYPMLTPGDIIVDITNQRFDVQSIAPRMASQYLIRQVLNLVPLEKGHPAYQTEVDLSELREF